MTGKGHRMYVLDGDVIHDPADPDDVLAHVDQRNPLLPDWQIPAQVAANQRLVTWTGTLADGDDLFAAHPHNWLQHGRAALDGFCERIVPELKQSHIHIVFRPHARHILSDPASTLYFLNDHLGEPFELALDPAAMLEPDMIPDIDEHFLRIFESLGSRAMMVLIRETDLPPGEIDDLIAEHVPATTPIVLLEKRLQESFFFGDL